jgi:hemolysin III
VTTRPSARYRSGDLAAAGHSAREAIRARAIERPRFRGVLHKWCFFASIPAGVLLVLTAPTGPSAFAAFSFAFGITAMLGISALFHRTDFDDHGWARFRRLDHVGIYLCIAGGYTPFGMFVVEGWAGRMMLIAGWGGAAAGTLLRFMPWEPPYGAMNALFITLGWVSVLTFPHMWRNLAHGWLIVLVIGGLLYTGGAIVLGMRRPDPWPEVFGYHEIWHACVAIAATLHYLVVAFAVLTRA